MSQIRQCEMTVRDAARIQRFWNATTSMLPSSSSTTAPPSLFPVVTVLYVCIGFNLVTHVLAMVFGFYAVRNFGKSLKQRVFNNQFDKWFQRHWPNIWTMRDERTLLLSDGFFAVFVFPRDKNKWKKSDAALHEVVLLIRVQRQYCVGPLSWISSICVPLLHQHPMGLFGLRLGYVFPFGPQRFAAFRISVWNKASSSTQKSLETAVINWNHTITIARGDVTMQTLTDIIDGFIFRTRSETIGFYTDAFFTTILDRTVYSENSISRCRFDWFYFSKTGKEQLGPRHSHRHTSNLALIQDVACNTHRHNETFLGTHLHSKIAMTSSPSTVERISSVHRPLGNSHASPFRWLGHEQRAWEVALALLVQTPGPQSFSRHGSVQRS